MFSNFGILVSRTLVKYIPFFKEHFCDVVVKHILHEHQSEMEKVSEVVPLGVLNKSEMKYEDMIAIMDHLHQYVAMITDVDLPEIGDKVEVTKTNFHTTISVDSQEGPWKPDDKVEFYHFNQADQRIVTNSRRLACQAMFVTGNLEETIQDVFRIRSWNTLPATATEHRRNVGKEPKKDFNAHDDFFNVATTSHVLAVAMEILGMSVLADDPSESLIPDDIQHVVSQEKSGS